MRIVAGQSPVQTTVAARLQPDLAICDLVASLESLIERIIRNGVGNIEVALLGQFRILVAAIEDEFRGAEFVGRIKRDEIRQVLKSIGAFRNRNAVAGGQYRPAQHGADRRGLGAAAKRHFVSAGVGVEMLVSEVSPESGAGIVCQAEAAAHRGLPRIASVEGTHVALGVPVGQKRRTKRQLPFDNRQACGALHVIGISRRQRALHVARGAIEVRTRRTDQDRPSRRRPTAEQALRAAKHFDLADVVDRGKHRLRIAGHFVEEDVDRRSGAGIRIERDAAQRRHVVAAARIGQFQSRCKVGDVADIEDVKLLDGLSCHDVDRQRRILQRHLPARGRHDDLVAEACPIRFSLRLDGRRGRDGRDGQHQLHRIPKTHSSLSLMRPSPPVAWAYSLMEPSILQTGPLP